MAYSVPGSFKKVKKKVFQRNFIEGLGQNFCEYCGKKNLQSIDQNKHDFRTVDHIVPRSKGGSCEQKNLAVCCRECNRAKSDKSVESFLSGSNLNKFLYRKRNSPFA